MDTPNTGPTREEAQAAMTKFEREREVGGSPEYPEWAAHILAALFKERDQTKAAQEQGMFRKFDIRRVDKSDAPGGRHHGCRYFVLDMDCDAHAPAALLAYADSCAVTHPELAADLRSEFASAPASTEAWLDELSVLQGSPDRIFLVIEDGDGNLPFSSFEQARHTANMGDGLMWCEDRQGPSDIEYVRAALAAQPAAAPADYEEVLKDHRRLVRDLDVLLNGEEGAAKQASLCDIVRQVASTGTKIAQPSAGFDVRTILLDVVPGDDGMGHEVYAKDVADVVRVLGEMSERIDALAAQPDANKWRDAVLDELALTCMDCSPDEPPRDIIRRISDWHVGVALDPLVSDAARALIEQGKAQPAADPVATHKCGTCGSVGVPDDIIGCKRCGWDDMSPLAAAPAEPVEMTDDWIAKVVTDAGILCVHPDAGTTRDIARAVARALLAAQTGSGK